MYNNPIMHIFAGIFVSGGFLITFGQLYLVGIVK
jgi:hypothetical protein